MVHSAPSSVSGPSRRRYPRRDLANANARLAREQITCEFSQLTDRKNGTIVFG
jgi:hypothetical protein